MGLGDTIAGLNRNSGYQGSTLKGFLQKFNSAEGNYVNTIDPLHTFDVNIAFYPMVGGSQKKDKNIKLVKAALASAAKNALNNVTGGILGSMLNDVDIMKLQKKFLGDKNFGKTTFIDYIARGNLLVTDDMSLGGASKKSISPQLIIDISYYVQNISIPNLTMPESGNVDTAFGSYPINGRIVKPSQNTFQLNIVNTKAPLAERVFYPWMREVTLPYWQYDDQPYTTATITVDFGKHQDLKYVFVGCRPSQIDVLQPSNQLGEPTRLVSMLFDHMFVESGLKTNEDLKSKMISLGTSVANNIGQQFGL